MRIAVLGAGRQGLAIAYDLARHGGARGVTLVEADAGALALGLRRLRRLLPGFPIRAVHASLGSGRDAVRLLRGHDAAVSAVPYRFNPGLARAALRARVPFCDLGGNTGLVQEALGLDRAAKRAGIGIVPDCGVAPGLANTLGAMLVAEVPGIRHVRVRCGGLPERPEGALGYALLFSIAGLTNEYTGEAVVLRGGRLRRFEAFTEPEPFDAPGGLGRLECFFTSGGTSTAPWTFRGRLETYEYKTVRYPGHFAKVRAMIDLGLLDLDPVRVGRARVVPREVFHAVAGPRLDRGRVRDLLVLRVDGTDRRGRGVRYEMLQRHDPRTGFSAMEQTTGYPAAVVAADLAARRLPPGATTPERCGYGAGHLRDLRRRGLRLRRTALRP
jgi:lysine 6-dehydrogenase